MVFGLFKRKDPVCGMKEEKGRGLEKHEKWFCSQDCAGKFDKVLKKAKKNQGKSCCG